MEVEALELASLVGVHKLTGCDYGTTNVERYGADEECSLIRFRLDGVTYTALEDSNDGYRSSMDKIFADKTRIKNRFPPVKVLARMKDQGDWKNCDILQLIDLVTAKVVLEVGTNNIDDYYPGFVGTFWPENMATNVGGAAMTPDLPAARVDALPPCPFCGSTSLFYNEPEELGDRVECCNCGAMGGRGSDTDTHGALKAWRMRAPTSLLAECARVLPLIQHDIALGNIAGATKMIINLRHDLRTAIVEG